MTNYEKIKNMSINEMTEFLNCATTQIALKLNGGYVLNEKDALCEWLESEAEE